MPKLTYKNCRGCSRPSSEVGVLSHTRLCATCSEELLVSNIIQMSDRRGPNFDAWRRSMVLCAYPALAGALDTLASGSHSSR